MELLIKGKAVLSSLYTNLTGQSVNTSSPLASNVMDDKTDVVVVMNDKPMALVNANVLLIVLLKIIYTLDLLITNYTAEKDGKIVSIFKWYQLKKHAITIWNILKLW